jgi:hypothetical protein
MRRLIFILILIFALAACAEDDADVIEDDSVEAEATTSLAPTFTIEISELDLSYPTEDLLGTVVSYEPVSDPSLTFDALGDGAKVTFMFDAPPTATGDYEIIFLASAKRSIHRGVITRGSPLTDVPRLRKTRLACQIVQPKIGYRVGRPGQTPVVFDHDQPPPSVQHGMDAPHQPGLPQDEMQRVRHQHTVQGWQVEITGEIGFYRVQFHRRIPAVAQGRQCAIIPVYRIDSGVLRQQCGKCAGEVASPRAELRPDATLADAVFN